MKKVKSIYEEIQTNIMSKKQTYLILFLLIAVVFAINLISFKNGHIWGDDFAAYIDQTRAMVSGNFDELISIHKYRVENSHGSSTGPFLAPWGFPILLSPIYYVFGLDIHVMKIYVNLFFLASLIIVFLLFQDRLKNIENLLLIAIIAFNPVYFKFKDTVMSDIPFLFFSLISLFLIKQFIVSQKIWINKFFSYLFIGFIIFFTIELRYIGYVLLPTLLLVQFIESKASIKKMVLDKFTFIPYIIFFILYAIKGLIFPGSSLSAYFIQGQSLETIFQGVIKHIKFYTILPSKFFLMDINLYDIFNHNTNWVHLLFYGIVLLFVVRGILFNIKRDYIFIVYGFLTLTILILNPFVQNTRYILHISHSFYTFFLQAYQISLCLSLLMKS